MAANALVVAIRDRFPVSPLHTLEPSHVELAAAAGRGRCVTLAPAPQTTAMLRAAHGEHRENVASSQTMTGDLGVIRAVAENAVRTTAGAPGSP